MDANRWVWSFIAAALVWALTIASVAGAGRSGDARHGARLRHVLRHCRRWSDAGRLHRGHLHRPVDPFGDDAGRISVHGDDGRARLRTAAWYRRRAGGGSGCGNCERRADPRRPHSFDDCDAGQRLHHAVDDHRVFAPLHRQTGADAAGLFALSRARRADARADLHCSHRWRRFHAGAHHFRAVGAGGRAECARRLPCRHSDPAHHRRRIHHLRDIGRRSPDCSWPPTQAAPRSICPRTSC